MARQNFLAPVFGPLLWLIFVSTAWAQNGGTWQQGAPMPLARQELASAVLNGKLYVIGGYYLGFESTTSVQVYNPATDTWALAHPLPYAVNHNSAAVTGGKLYSFGAGGGVFVYNSNNNSWGPVASTHFVHSATAAVGVIDNQIYVAGGTGTPSQRELEVYDPVANRWTIKAPMSVPRNHTAGGVIDGKFYVVGGRLSPNAVPTAALEVYNPQTNTWSTRTPMPTARAGIAAAVVNNEFWVFGGEEMDGLHPEVEVYNPVSNSWRRSPNMPLPRHGAWASVIGNKIYIPGGGALAGLAPTRTNQVFTVDVASAGSQLSNISTRSFVQTDANVLIGGFIIEGTEPKTVIVRAIGPELTRFGVPNPLADPTLELHNGAGALIASNNNWQATIIGGVITSNQVSAIQSSGHAATQPSESAIIATLQPGNYTAIIRGVSNTVGVALVEVYDLSADTASILSNISTRSFVQTGNDVMIGGFIVEGSGPKTVIVRAIGPELTRFGVPNALADPTLDLHNGAGALIASNNNWQNTIIGGVITSNQVSAIQNSGHPPNDPSESALIATLQPGNYTAIVRGVSGTVGVALVEVYDID
jgi:N-acetylneuraminic acid mutarotase